MSDDIEAPSPRQSVDPEYNREGGEVIVAGSELQKMRAKFEQFPHSKWAFGNPGNPYKFRRWPAMMYRAERRNGKIMCMEGEPQSHEYQHERNYVQAIEAARAFTQKCQITVGSQEEWSRAMDAGYRDSPTEAVEECARREKAAETVIAHGNFEDRNMSPLAQAEKAADIAADGGTPSPEVKEKRRVRKASAA